MDNFRIAVKAFIINQQSELFLIKRRKKDPHFPDIWEIPGGRLKLGESPFEGLKREVKEETALDINIKLPLAVKHFVRDDSQKITMLIFLCDNLSNEVRLSEEHTDFTWVQIQEARDILVDKFHHLIDTYEEYFS